MPRSHLPVRIAIVATLATLWLAACASGPVYKPKGPGEYSGYTDERLAENRYRVTFSGNSGTPREQVEDFLLRRAAEVTLQSGFTHFVFDTRDTEARTYYRHTFDTWNGFGPFGPGFRPWYWSTWPYPPEPVMGESIPITRYTAYAEIVMLTVEQATQDPHAIKASDILARLNPPAPPAPPPGPHPPGY